MITRAQMPRQLRNKGGITNAVPRKKYGIGSKFQEYKDKALGRVRKLIPNELADVAVKAAPFVAPFNPGIAALMRGIGRFDQRGSLSDAFKQGLGTFAFGKLAGKIPGTQDYFGRGMEGAKKLAGDVRTKAGNILDRRSPKKVFGADDALGGEMQTVGKKGVVETLKTGAKNVLQDLPKGLKGQLIAGGLSAGASLLASYFQGEFREQEPGETIDEYLAARRESVGKKMRVYMDNYFKTDPEYSALDDAGRDAFVARYNLQSGGRVGYQTGGITMANTLAENIRRNLANQAAINQKLEQARTKLPTGITRTKSGYTTNKPAIDPTGMLPQTSTLNPDLEQAIKNARAAGRNKEYIDTMLRERQDDQAIDFFKNLQPTPTPTPTSERVRFITETGEPASGPGPNVGRIIEQEEFKPPEIDMTGPMFTGFDYSQPVNWSPGQPAPEGYRVVNMMGDEFLERIYPSKEEIARLPMPLMGPAGRAMPLGLMMPPSGNYEDNFQDPDAGLSGKEYAEKYGLEYAKGGRVNFEEGGTGFMKWLKANYGLEVKDLDLEQYVKYSREFNNENPDPNETGRKKNAMGSMPVGIMRTNKAGVMERDYRDKGGFVPVGIKEKADDVPAMLSKNEFVFTADAVRGAGNGSIEKGAQKMYNTMKNLEKRVV